MDKNKIKNNPFNSPLESGIRSLTTLVELFPQAYDLQRLVVFDHLIVHTGDLNGPGSLHPSIPMRSAELLVRRGIVERGLLLLISRGLVEREVKSEGILYRAGEFAETFLNSLTSTYTVELRKRAQWVVEQFADKNETELRNTVHCIFDRWLEEFQSTEVSAGGKA